MRQKIGLIIFILAVSFCLIGFQQEAHANNEPAQFDDLNSSKWAWDSIYFLAGKKVVNGYGKGKFGPTNKITRGQAAAILVRELYPNAKATSGSPYSDLPKNHMFYNDILIATEMNIFEGAGSGKFNPDIPIDRAAVAKILAVAYGLTAGNTAAHFSDTRGHWGEDYISLLSSNKIINGYTDGTFKPNNNVTRAEFSKMLAETLVHKDPSIWVTPQVDNNNSYLPDPTKTYKFRDDLGDYTLSFIGFDNRGYQRWKQEDSQDSLEVELAETEKGAAIVFTGQDVVIDYYLGYPLFVGKTWENYGVNLMGITLNTITSLNATVDTPAGKFENLIEVTDSDGYVHYIAQGHGHIALYEKTGSGMRPLNIVQEIKNK